MKKETKEEMLKKIMDRHRAYEKMRKEVDLVMRKAIKDFGCFFEAARWDDDTIIEACAKSGHKLYHDPNSGNGTMVSEVLI